jgi:hypothetical protein
MMQRFVDRAIVVSSDIIIYVSIIKIKFETADLEFYLVGFAREIWCTRGITGFFTGLTPRLLRRTLMASLSWTLYEHMMRRQRPARP